MGKDKEKQMTKGDHRKRVKKRGREHTLDSGETGTGEKGLQSEGHHLGAMVLLSLARPQDLGSFCSSSPGHESSTTAPFAQLCKTTRTRWGLWFLMASLTDSESESKTRIRYEYKVLSKKVQTFQNEYPPRSSRNKVQDTTFKVQ